MACGYWAIFAMINVSLQGNERMRAILSGFSQPTSILHGQLISLALWQKKVEFIFGNLPRVKSVKSLNQK